MDLRRAVPSPTFQRAMRRAVDLELISEAELPGEPALTRSELERLFLRLCRRFGLEKPEVNARVGRFEVDFLWPAQCLVVETDGFQHHGNRLAFESDRARDAELQALGYRVLRFTYRQLTESPSAVAARLRTVLNR